MRELILSFEQKSHLQYSLPDSSSLILLKDERKLNSYKRFEHSPFPLLSNIDYFSNSVGDWNSDLQRFKIKTRFKLGDELENHSPSARIHLILRHSLSSQGNKSLKHKYKLLRLYRKKGWITSYWKICLDLLTHDWNYKLACLNSWDPLWYKTKTLNNLSQLWKGLNSILSLETLNCPIQNVWIESPKNKWRQLGIPPQSWRLYWHAINQFLSYIYEPLLPKEQYDGFIFNRGCKSWWESVLWTPLLKTYSSIIELDFSSGFPNLHRYYVVKALKHDKLVPLNLINLITNQLNSSVTASSDFPTVETFIEHKENQPWRHSSRSVHMGIGVSPILFVITFHWCFQQLNLLSSNFTYKSYADDISLYLTYEGYFEIKEKLQQTWWNLFLYLLQGQNPILASLNNHSLLKETGLRICSQKSGFVRLFNIWLKPYRSLGLSLLTSWSIWKQIYELYLQGNSQFPMTLKASTRGRGANLPKGKTGTLPSHLELNFPCETREETLNLELLLKKYKPYFGLILAKLYSTSETSFSQYILTSKVNSPLFKLNPQKQNKFLKPLEKWNLYNCSTRMNNIFLGIVNNQKSLLKDLPRNLVRELDPNWKNPPNFIKEYIKSNIPKPNLNLKEMEKEYFKKYSELKLETSDLVKYHKMYDQLNLKKTEKLR